VLERRRTTRQASGWSGTCLIEDETHNGAWRECAVLDISPFGLGITLRDVDASHFELVGRDVAVEFPAVSDWVSIRVEGKIRNAALIRPGLVRAGVEFVGLSEAERAIATVLGVLTAIDQEWAESQVSHRPLLPQAIA
jgi:PilZ domain